jgi:ATP-dependent DNA helicase RecQ
MNEAMLVPSKAHFLLSKADLYSFQVENRTLDPIIKLMLRSYTGMFDDFVRVSEADLAKRASITKGEVAQMLNKLDMLGVISYKPQNQLPQIIYTQPRIDAKLLKGPKREYDKRKQLAAEKLQAVMDYAKSNNACRSQMLMKYFGERNTHRCGICDVCLDRNRLELSQLEFDEVLNNIKPILTEDPVTLEELMNNIEVTSEERAIKVIQWLLDNKKLKYDQEERLQWIKN